MTKQINTLEYFRLRPIKSARVSEVSEATASSSASVEDRVNFHIGNPVQDKALSSAFLRMILGLEVDDQNFSEDNLEKIREELGWVEEDKSKLQFFLDLIKKSAPYMPSGGFNKKSPNLLIKYFNEWLIKNQQEPLSYDLGETSGRREIILASGGVFEAIRLLFHSLSNYLNSLPATIYLYGITLPEHLKTFSNLKINVAPFEEGEMILNLQENFNKSPNIPAFLLLGKNTKEETRRKLRLLSLDYPLFFVEINNAPNHLSLAREAKMINRVVRILTPGIFSPLLDNLSTVFIAGNADYIRVIETVQFQLKGTPSASEVELLSFVLKENIFKDDNSKKETAIEIEPAYENSHLLVDGVKFVKSYVKDAEEKLSGIVDKRTKQVEKILERVIYDDNYIAKKIEKLTSLYSYDLFSNNDSRELLNKFVENLHSREWINELVNSFLFSFIKHHPEYKISNSIAVSGSSRTALGLLGYHCGIKEVIIPDLSWTYEHCFPSVSVVSLTDDYELDVDAMIDLVKTKLIEDPNWKTYGSVVLNNPHNATGQEFNRESLTRLLKWLLERKIFVIDDLSYQNVEPADRLREIKTIRQLADELQGSGYLSGEETDYLITVHSVSKTDSLAGARLSVIEIRHPEMYKKFQAINSTIQPNAAALFLTYMFYRNRAETVNSYWRLRNKIFDERMNSLREAVNILPKERNLFDINIKSPKGSMYPQMIIDKLPVGLSLDWLASGLARQGIGLLPLSTFARTEKGFETGRKTFRLTLGGTDNAETLLKKTRRVLIDLNRMIAEESSNYSCKKFIINPPGEKKSFSKTEYYDRWDSIEQNILKTSKEKIRVHLNTQNNQLRGQGYELRFEEEFLPERLSLFKQRFNDRLTIAFDLMEKSLTDKGKSLIETLKKEFYKDNLERRKNAFKERLYDRTVHPTQMYSLKLEILFEELIEHVIKKKNITEVLIKKSSEELVQEFLGLNIAIVSSEEPVELLIDLKSFIAAENYTKLYSDHSFQVFHSFWGDWDGSNRPSGQGHSL
ncbi:MAG: aminotransferase class I/II-fold pyridoxal phosphate-dependent enzyme, partial [Bacteroidota bacterium]